MTHSGGKPHAVGDKGQRYEVTFFDPETNKRQVLGWSKSKVGAESLAECVFKHPSWTEPVIEDREASNGK